MTPQEALGITAYIVGVMVFVLGLYALDKWSKRPPRA